MLLKTLAKFLIKKVKTVCSNLVVIMTLLKDSNFKLTQKLRLNTYILKNFLDQLTKVVYRNSLLYLTVLTLTCGKTSSLKSLIIRQTHLWVLNNHKTQNSTIDKDAILSLCLVLLLLVKLIVILMEDTSLNSFSVKENQISKITSENLLESVKEIMAVL